MSSTDDSNCSAFDEYDRANGYLTEAEERQYYTDFIFSLYDIAISKQGMSFNDCEEMDIIGYIKYLNYCAYRKDE
ncbi:MAG: hypothetical protein K0S61_2959 [Anaerocolumna sp.]|nr:hypothetical protein [Anaerocolumna sp.]